ncbi:leucine-rich PPR motif-containing protein, mitochondrial [Aricia agestis]|uniref:leucine-rich PPR motif-containing protein, mitochondrial n=1 Tax=Aricia agestis TaxID=91739 RepID=UPI001C202496|nr:leucine-rich PPR motif-containing protein, mitochondrial [Aricia agestis]
MSSLLRSTKFVRYFTGAARTLILSSSKTAEANLLLNSKAVTAANNVLLRDYATNKKESLEPLLQKIDSEVKRFGRITKRDIDEVFDEIRSKNDITSSQSLLVIRCCGELVPEELPEQRTLLVQKIWNVLNERGVPMDVSHYNALLRVYLENEHAFSPAQFLEEMEKKGLQPNRVTYQRLMWRYCQEGDVEGATKVLEKMRELNMPVSEPVLNALVMGHAFHGDTDGAKAVLETMAGAGLSPSNRTYGLLACGYAKKGDIDGVENVLAMAKEKDILLTDRDLLDIIEHLALGGHEEKMERIFPHLHKTLGYNQEVCILVYKLLNNGLESAARKVVQTMAKVGNTEDTMFKGAFYVKHLVKLNIPVDKIIQSCRELQSEGIIPSAIYIATEASLQLGKSELALKLFKEFQKDGYEIRQHYYWPLLAQKGKERDEEGLLEIVRTMCYENLIPTGEAIRDYILPPLLKKDTPQNVLLKLQITNVPIIHAARNVVVESLERGEIQEAANIALQYRPRGQFSLVARSLIGALSKTKDIKSFAQILHVTSSNYQPAQEDVGDDSQSDDTDNSSEVGRIVKIGVKAVAKDNLTEELLREVLSKGLRINTASAEDIQLYLGNELTTKISELLTQLTSQDLEIAPLENSNARRQAPRTSAELETLIEKLKGKENAYLNNLYKQLLSLYIQEKNVDKVTNYLQQLKEANFELSNATLAQLFEFYCENGEVEKAKDIQAQLAAKSPDFNLNGYKKILMAYALVRANKYDEAMKYLTENKSQDPATNNYMANSKAWQMLNVLAEQKEDKLIKEMTSLLIENSYVEPNNVILGPSIKVHIVKDDLDAALKEFEYCCNHYRSTPWKGELMKALIMKEDATKLQWLADLSTQIHGEVNILHDLVLAFVECGRLRQARRILETPGLHTRNRRLEDACQRYVNEGKSEYLEGLLEATKELSHIDRSKIFYHLLVTYCKADETEKALGLWTVLQEDGEVPSDQFLVYLGNHLKAKRRDVPFVIPQQTQQEKPRQEPAVNKETEQQKQTSRVNITEKLQNLLDEGKIDDAFDCTLVGMKEGNIPRATVIKYLLKKLAENGNMEKIQEIGNHLSEPMLKKVAHEDKLTLAKFNSGSGTQHVDRLFASAESPDANKNIDEIVRQFPKSVALSKVVQSPDMLSKCEKIADIAASKGFKLPANLLWMELLLSGKDTEANNIWNKHLVDSDSVIFRRLLQVAHERKQPQIIEKMIENLNSSPKISNASKGNAFSRLINYYVGENELQKAKECLDRAYGMGLTLDDINKTSIDRLNKALGIV